jgi:hypothetical protein
LCWALTACLDDRQEEMFVWDGHDLQSADPIEVLDFRDLRAARLPSYKPGPQYRVRVISKDE